MFGLVRLLIFGFIVLTAIYIFASWRSRSTERARLEAEWDTDIRDGDREAFVTAGMKDYDGSLRRKLILGVYVIPIVIVAAIIYVTNYT